MAFAVKHAKKCIENKWIIGRQPSDVLKLLDEAKQALLGIEDIKHSPVLITDPDPVRFICALFATLETGAPAFLGNPNWGTREWAQCSAQISPRHIFGPHKYIEGRAPAFPQKLKQCIAIPTGGSGNILKFAIHQWKTLKASSDATHNFFDLKKSDSCCTLPLYHVSGLMQVIRSYISGGHILFMDWKRIEEGSFPRTEDFQISLVPTQLERLLKKEAAVDWLKQFSIIYLGGASANPETLKKARAHKLPIAPCYGTTETAAMLAAQLPSEFLISHTVAAAPLPHTSIQIVNEKGSALPDARYGNVRIESSSLADGYFHERICDNKYKRKKYFDTDDEGMRSEDGRLYIRCRLDRIIISGGEKINPAHTTQALLETKLVDEVKVIGLDDKEWGQVLAVAYTAKNNTPPEALKEAIKGKLAPHMIPKLWAQTKQIPANTLGKIDIDQLKTLF